MSRPTRIRPRSAIPKKFHAELNAYIAMKPADRKKKLAEFTLKDWDNALMGFRPRMKVNTSDLFRHASDAFSSQRVFLTRVANFHGRYAYLCGSDQPDEYILRAYIALSSRAEVISALKILLEDVIPSKVEMKATSFTSCCAIRGFYLKDKDLFGRAPSSDDFYTAIKKKDFYPNKTTATDDRATGVFLKVNRKVLGKYYKRKMSSLGWHEFAQVDGEVYFFLWFVCNETHAATIKKARYTPKLEEGKFHGRGRASLNRSSFLKTARVFYQFPEKRDSGYSEAAFKDSKYPIQLVCLRDCSASGYSMQIDEHFNTLVDAGFAPVTKDSKPFLNGVYPSHQHWIMPMFRINPDYEEDR